MKIRTLLISLLFGMTCFASAQEPACNPYLSPPELCNPEDYAQACRETLIRHYNLTLQARTLHDCRYIWNPYSLKIVDALAHLLATLDVSAVSAASWADNEYGMKAAESLIRIHRYDDYNIIRAAAQAKTLAQYECIDQLSRQFDWIPPSVVRACL